MTNVLTMIMCLFSMLFNTVTPVERVSNENTSVIEDLSKDPEFVNNKNIRYPVNNNDYTVDIIQLGIGEQNELFIYAYVPAVEVQPVEFSSITISLDEKYLDYKNYSLKFINSDSVFYKLQVSNIDLGSNTTKHIGITTIYRNYNPDLGDSEMREYAYNISQKWVIDNVNGKLNYYMNELVTYEIQDSYQGWIRYSKNANVFNKKSCDGHFIAFKENPNYKIDFLKEADVIYKETKHQINYSILGSKENDGYPKVVNGKANLKYTDSVSVSNDYKFAWFKRKFTWNRIMNVEDFIAQENKNSTVLDSTAQSNLRKYSYVLSFLETDYSDEYVPVPPGQPATNHTKTYSTVDNTSVVRLKFEQDGETYDLPVVGNKHNQPSKPDGGMDLNPNPGTIVENAKNWWDDMAAWLQEQGAGFMKILKALLLICGLLLFAKPIEWIVKGVGGLFKAIFSVFKSDDKDK